MVTTCVNLNGKCGPVKNLKINNQSVHWFGLTELNKTMGRICGMKNSKT